MADHLVQADKSLRDASAAIEQLESAALPRIATAARSLHEATRVAIKSAGDELAKIRAALHEARAVSIYDDPYVVMIEGRHARLQQFERTARAAWRMAKAAYRKRVGDGAYNLPALVKLYQEEAQEERALRIALEDQRPKLRFPRTREALEREMLRCAIFLFQRRILKLVDDKVDEWVAEGDAILDEDGQVCEPSGEPMPVQRMIDCGLYEISWETDRVFLTREDGEDWGRATDYNYPNGWRVWATIAEGDLVRVLDAATEGGRCR